MPKNPIHEHPFWIYLRDTMAIIVRDNNSMKNLMNANDETAKKAVALYQEWTDGAISRTATKLYKVLAMPANFLIPPTVSEMSIVNLVKDPNDFREFLEEGFKAQRMSKYEKTLAIRTLERLLMVLKRCISTNEGVVDTLKDEMK